jgi:glucose dehydrogenase
MIILRRLILIGVGGILLCGGLYMATVSALAPLRQETLTQPRIFAYRGWQSMGVQLEKDDYVTIRAKGEWLYTPGEVHGPEGHARYPAPSFYPLPNLAGSVGTRFIVPGGVLIGRIGESSAPFLVGRGTTVKALEPGTLYLRINDDILSDNEGWVDVQVGVEHSVDENP